MSVTSASSAISFTSAIGINTHIDWSGSTYQDSVAVENALSYLGVGLVRDVINNVNDAAQYAQLNADLGVKFDFFIAPGAAGFDWQLKQIEANPDIVAFVEGANESDAANATQYYKGLSGLDATKAEQAALYASVHADPDLAGVQVIQTSFARDAHFATYGDQSGTADLANIHLYFGTANNPGAGTQIAALIDYAQIVTPGAPNVVTEMGFFTVPGDPNGVSLDVQAKYDLFDIFDAWKAGIKTSFLYQLVDPIYDPNNTDWHMHYGVFNADWTPKPAAIAIHNLMTLLDDDGKGGHATGTLDYTLSGMPSTANSLLLEKSDGTFVLALWNDVRLSGPLVQSDIVVAPVSVTLTLTRPYQSVAVFDPLTGTTAVQTFTSAQTVEILVPDHPVLVEISDTPIAVPASNLPTIEAPDHLLATADLVAQVPGLSIGNGPDWTLNVTVSDSVGVLSMTDAFGRPLLGSGGHAITLSGSLATVNAELATLTFRAQDSFTRDSIAVVVHDSAGHTTRQSIDVVPAAVPATQVPERAWLGLPSALTMGPGRTVAIGNAVLADDYYATHDGTLTMTLSVVTGTLSVTVAGTPTAATQSITVSGSYATIADELASLTYTALNHWGDDTLSVVVTDPGGRSAFASTDINVVRSLTLSGPTTLNLVVQDSGSLGGLQVCDVYAAGNADLLTLKITDTIGALSMRDGSGRLVSGSGGHVLMFSGTPDEVNAALGTLTYATGDDLTSETVNVAAWNTAGKLIRGTVAVSVVPRLVVTAPDSSAVGNMLVGLIGGVSLSDSSDGDPANQVTVTVTDLYGPLSMVNAAGDAWAGSGGNSITVTGALGTVNAALASLTYTAPGWAAPEVISIAATDSFGAVDQQQITVPVVSVGTLSSYFQVSDAAGHPFSRQPFLTSGTMTLTSAATGLSAAVIEQVAPDGTVSLASDEWNVVSSATVVDNNGGSYALSNFAWAAVTLSGGPTGAGASDTLTLNTVQRGIVNLGSGNQTLVINAFNDPDASPSHTFTITLAGGADDITINGFAGITTATINAGSGDATMKFVDTGKVRVNGGAGHLTIDGGDNGNSVIAGTGTVDVSGGSGLDTYTYHAGAGVLILRDFVVGDALVVDQSLKASETETVTSRGATIMFGGSSAHEIVAVGATVVPHISWR